MTKRTYYQTRQDASAVRTGWDRIYYDADERAYYIVEVKSFWES